MELNPINDNFEIELPENLITLSVRDAFQKILTGRYTVHSDIMDYIAESLQSISLPDFVGDAIAVNSKDEQTLHRPAFTDMFRISEQHIVLTFRHIEANVNFMMFRLSYDEYIKNREIGGNIGNLTFTVWANDRSFNYVITFQNCVLLGTEGKEFSYVDNEVNNNESFSIGLKYSEHTYEVNVFNYGEDGVSAIEENTSSVPFDSNGDGISEYQANVISKGADVPTDIPNIELYLNGKLISSKPVEGITINGVEIYTNEQ